MSASEKQIATTSSNTPTFVDHNQSAFDIKDLGKRLAKLIEHDPSSQVSFGYVVLSSIAQGQYDRATKELQCVGVGFEEYPAFDVRSRRFVEHAKGLVDAIKTKHSVARSPHINRAKQKELSDRIAEHFVDLKKTLITIEKIQKSVRTADLSSTLVFFKTAFYAVIFIFAAYTVFLSQQHSDSYSIWDLISLLDLQWPG